MPFTDIAGKLAFGLGFVRFGLTFGDCFVVRSRASTAWLLLVLMLRCLVSLIYLCGASLLRYLNGSGRSCSSCRCSTSVSIRSLRPPSRSRNPRRPSEALRTSRLIARRADTAEKRFELLSNGISERCRCGAGRSGTREGASAWRRSGSDSGSSRDCGREGRVTCIASGSASAGRGGKSKVASLADVHVLSSGLLNRSWSRGGRRVDRNAGTWSRTCWSHRRRPPWRACRAELLRQEAPHDLNRLATSLAGGQGGRSALRVGHVAALRGSSGRAGRARGGDFRCGGWLGLAGRGGLKYVSKSLEHWLLLLWLLLFVHISELPM